MKHRRPDYKEWLLIQLRRSEEGQSILEVALALPLLITFLGVSAMFAQAAYFAIEVSNAAKAGVAYGAQSISTAADTTGIKNAAVLDAGNINLPAGNVTVTATGVCSSGATCSGGVCTNTSCTTNPGDHIETILSVDTSYVFTPVVHIPGLPSSYTLRGHATQICLP